jgi:uncharacterized protein
MFRRRQKLSLRAKIGGFFWPRIGWKRAGLYYWYRLHRMEGTSRSIASGLAFGVAAAMTPFYGLHTVVAIALAWLFGANVVAAAVGTLANNPWTAPPLWFGTYYVGAWILGGDTSSKPNFVHMFKTLTESVLSRDMDLFAGSIWPVLKPMAVGCIPFALVAGFVTYFVLEPVIRTMHLERALRFAKHPHHPKDTRP